MVLLSADGDAHPGHGSSSRHYSENSRNFRTTRLAFPFCQRTRRFSTRKNTGAAERTKQRKKITLLTVYSVLTVWLQYTGSKNAFSCRPQPRNLIFSWRRCVYVFWGLLRFKTLYVLLSWPFYWEDFFSQFYSVLWWIYLARVIQKLALEKWLGRV